MEFSDVLGAPSGVVMDNTQKIRATALVIQDDIRKVKTLSSSSQTGPEIVSWSLDLLIRQNKLDCDDLRIVISIYNIDMINISVLKACIGIKNYELFKCALDAVTEVYQSVIIEAVRVYAKYFTSVDHVSNIDDDLTMRLILSDIGKYSRRVDNPLMLVFPIYFGYIGVLHADNDLKYITYDALTYVLFNIMDLIVDFTKLNAVAKQLTEIVVACNGPVQLVEMLSKALNIGDTAEDVRSIDEYISSIEVLNKPDNYTPLLQESV